MQTYKRKGWNVFNTLCVTWIFSRTSKNVRNTGWESLFKLTACYVTSSILLLASSDIFALDEVVVILLFVIMENKFWNSIFQRFCWLHIVKQFYIENENLLILLLHVFIIYIFNIKKKVKNKNKLRNSIVIIILTVLSQNYNVINIW